MHMTKYHKDRKPRQEPYKKRDYDGKSKKRDNGAKTEERAYQLASKQKKKRVEYDTSEADTSESEGSVRSTKGQAGDYLTSALKKPAYKKARVRMMTNRGGTRTHPTVTSVMVPGRLYYKCWIEETSEVCILTAMETYKRINKIQVLDNKTGYTYSWEQRGPNPAMRRKIMVAVQAVEDTGECVMLTAAILHFGDDSDVDQGADGASVSSAVASPEAEAEAMYDGINVDDAIDVDMESVDVSEGTDEGEEISILGMDARQGNREACREYLTRNIDCVSRQKTLNIVKNLLRRDKADTATFRRRMGGMMRRAILTADRTADDLTFVVDKEVDRRIEVRLRELHVKNSPVPAFLRVGRLWLSERSSSEMEVTAEDLEAEVGTDPEKSVLVTEGLMAAVSMYSRHGHTVEKIVTDSEATFRKCEAALDRIRTILAAMTYELPGKLYGMLLEAVPNRIAASDLVLDTNTISSLDTERLLDTLDDTDENYHPSTDRAESGAETDAEQEHENSDESRMKETPSLC
ncbi:hypothetical protein B484DRAFT_401403 [Ochromonadaceae sp. CCMP2298]|nr:hypothetical protein B484DRAFT_401403 [Ochromonadaceae sp. CCMP2298]